MSVPLNISTSDTAMNITVCLVSSFLCNNVFLESKSYYCFSHYVPATDVHCCCFVHYLGQYGVLQLVSTFSFISTLYI